MTWPDEQPVPMRAHDDESTHVALARLDEQIKGLGDAFTNERTASKEAIAAAFKAAETATQAALAAQKESAGKAEENAQKQLEMHNGLIRKMDNLVAGFPTKDSVTKDFESRDQRLNVLDRAVSRAYGAAASALALAGTVLAYVLAHH